MLPSVFNLLPVLLPILGGAVLFFFPEMDRRARNIYTFVLSLTDLALVVLTDVLGTGEGFVVLHFMRKYEFCMQPDTFGKLFATMVSILWPFSLMYGYEYMEKEERQHSFFAFYTMTLGVVVGIAFAKDILTMYLFYEMLTLVTFPLVMHPMTDEAMKAGRTYLCYSLGGAAFALIGIIFVMNYGSSLDFTFGGVFADADPKARALLIFVFLVTFCGFSVKAAMMPFGKWLIKAAVAPTPVTALLHAVAVVKAGAFAVIRLIYYIYGADYLRGTWGQYAAITLTSLTILYGSVMAVKEQHLKRRLAYSTLSNLSYILFGACLMTTAGFTAAILHLLAHAFAKIGLFFCVGSVMHVTGRNYVYEVDGFGKKMKWIFADFTLLSLSVIGIPQLSGFISKLRLILASIDADNLFGYIGIGAILISAVLTAIYLLKIAIRAYFPSRDVKPELEGVHDPGFRMIVPIVFSSVATIALGIWWQPVVDIINTVF